MHTLEPRMLFKAGVNLEIAKYIICISMKCISIGFSCIILILSFYLQLLV